MYLEGIQKYLQDFRRAAYNAVLKWKPKSELSGVSNSAQTQKLHVSTESTPPIVLPMAQEPPSCLVFPMGRAPHLSYLLANSLYFVNYLISIIFVYIV
jgi:hypothetical protein